MEINMKEVKVVFDSILNQETELECELEKKIEMYKRTSRGKARIRNTGMDINMKETKMAFYYILNKEAQLEYEVIGKNGYARQKE